MAKFFLNFLILAIFPVAFTLETDYELDVLKNLTDVNIKKIQEIGSILDETPKHYREKIADRFECLQWECVVQQKNVNRSTINAVSSGLIKNKKLPSFQCVSNKSREALDKLNARCSNFPQNSEAVLQNGLKTVLLYKLLLPGYEEYIKNLYQTKKEELIKTNKEETKKKILQEVQNKMKFLETILEQICADIENLKNNFFEIYINFVHAEETVIRKTQREGSQNILKCVS